MTQDYISFKKKIIQHGEINAAYVEFPFSTEKLFGMVLAGHDVSQSCAKARGRFS